MMHALLDGIVDIAYLMDTDGHLVYVNAAAGELGYDPKQLIGSSVLTIIHADDRAKVVQAMQQRKQGSRNTILLNLRLRGTDGQVVPFEMKSKMINFKNGNGVNGTEMQGKISGDYILGTARNISDRKILEDALQGLYSNGPHHPAGNDGNAKLAAAVPDRLPEMLLLPGRKNETLSREMAIAWATSDYETEIIKNRTFRLEDKIRLTLGCAEVLYRQIVEDKIVRQAEMQQLNELSDNFIKFVTYIKTIGGGVPELIKGLVGRQYRTPEHSVRVGLYSVLFTLELTPRFMMIARGQMITACTGALLHDVGKVKLDQAIVTGSPKLSSDQLKELRTHPAVGTKMIQTAGASLDVQQTVFQHHQVFSASNNGVSAKNFNPFAFVVAICNTFDNLTSIKPGVPARNTYDALVLMVKNMRGEVFSRMLKPFIKLMGEQG
jgi:PAS domain S-box-containing protein